MDLVEFFNNTILSQAENLSTGLLNVAKEFDIFVELLRGIAPLLGLCVFVFGLLVFNKGKKPNSRQGLTDAGKWMMISGVCVALSYLFMESATYSIFEDSIKGSPMEHILVAEQEISENQFKSMAFSILAIISAIAHYYVFKSWWIVGRAGRSDDPGLVIGSAFKMFIAAVLIINILSVWDSLGNSWVG